MVRFVAIGIAILITGSAFAQLDRRSRDEPEMFIEAGGRSGTCDYLTYSPDGKLLYAGGDDKVVRVWPVGGSGLETGRMRTLRWPAWRDQRGGIKTIALPADPADRRVLVAGFGLANGLVVLLDAGGEIVATNDVAGSKLPATAVMASTFAPDGKSVVYGTADGRLWSWDLAKANREIGRHAPIGEKDFNRPRLIRFIDDAAFVSVAESGQVLKGVRRDGRWTVVTTLSIQDQLRAAIREQKLPPPDGTFRVYRADLSADGKWLACAIQHKYVVLAALDGTETRLIEIGVLARSLAFDRAGRLAVASAGFNSETRFNIDSNDTIMIFAKPTANQPAHELEIKHAGRAEALAWNADGLLAIAGGDNHEVTLHDLKALAAKPFPLQVVRGKGRGIWDVRVGKDGESFLFRTDRNRTATDPNERGDGPWFAFDYAIGKSVEPGTAVPVRKTADGWKVGPTKSNPMLWDAVNEAQGIRHPLTLDPDRDEQPRCYCFLPAKGDKPTRLLVGHYYGFSLFELTRAAATRTMLGTGQAGDVMSIAADADGSWFVTGGADQTVAGWSLADWPSGPFGAAFNIKDDRLYVTAVDIGGPAWEMGLSKGDEIVLAVGGGKRIFARAGKYISGDIAADEGNSRAALDVLAKPTPGREIYLGWKRPGGAVVEGLSTLRRRPIWRFFPAFESNERFDHWVAWLWKGGHYATSTSGDYLVGWQLNDPETIIHKRPQFFLANRFKGLLHRKLAVLRAMQTRDLAGALTELAGDNPQPPKFGGMEPAPVRLDVGAATVGKDGMRIAINVAARGVNPDLLPERVELWVNDHRVRQWNAGGKGVAAAETLPESVFRNGNNEITVLTFNAAGGRGEARQTVASSRVDQKPRLLGLLVGINDYSRTAKNPDGTREFGNLNSANNDARKLGEAWKAQIGAKRLYSEERLIVSLDPNAYQKDILAALDALAKEATPDDRVVIFLAGHGDYVPRTGAAKGSDEKVFAFCCPNYSRGKWAETSVTGDMLFDRLAQCKARKLILIDACHSGQAANENVIRHLIPEGQGPMIIAACDQKELSFEHAKLGHGLFTAAVLEALGDKFKTADRSKDGALDPQELFDYVRTRLPSLLKETGKPERIQNPQSFPLELGRYAIARE